TEMSVSFIHSSCACRPPGSRLLAFFSRRRLGRRIRRNVSGPTLYALSKPDTYRRSVNCGVSIESRSTEAARPSHILPLRSPPHFFSNYLKMCYFHHVQQVVSRSPLAATHNVLPSC